MVKSSSHKNIGLKGIKTKLESAVVQTGKKTSRKIKAGKSPGSSDESAGSTWSDKKIREMVNRAKNSYKKKSQANKKYYEERPWLVPKLLPKRDIAKEIISEMPL